MVSVVLPDAVSPTAAVATAAALAVYWLVSRPRSLPPNAHAPRRLKKSHWLLGDVAELLANATRFNDWVLEKTIECGEQPWLRHVPGMPDMVMVATPAIVEDVARTQQEAFGKGDFTYELMQDLIGDSFFVLDGEKWLVQRKIASKFFSARMYREVATPVVQGHTGRFVAKLQHAATSGESVNLTSLLNAFALQTFAELGFGLNIDQIDPAPLDNALEEAFEHVFRRVQSPAWVWKLQRFLNVGEERKFGEIARFIRTFVSELVSQSLQKSSEKSSEDAVAATMVELFIDAMHKGEGDISPELLCDIAIMVVLGGRDTTTDTLNWFFYNMYKHPEIEDKIRKELWKNVPELMDGTIATLTMEQTSRLTFLEATIKETLRLFPVVTINPRQALRDTVLVDGTFIPKGMSMGISAFAMGRLTSAWGEDASEFKPERFLDDVNGKLKVVSPFKFFSFGGGPKNCIGMNLAMLEMKQLVATVFSRFRFEMEPNDGKYKFSANHTLEKPLVARVHAIKVDA